MLLHTSSHCKQLDMTPHELFIAGWIDIDSPDDPYDEFAPQIRGASTSGKRCADSLRIGVFKNLPSTSALVHCEGGGCCLLLFKSADSMYSISICCRRCGIRYPAVSQNKIISEKHQWTNSMWDSGWKSRIVVKVHVEGTRKVLGWWAHFCRRWRTHLCLVGDMTWMATCSFELVLFDLLVAKQTPE